ncbi:MAG: helix-turn-helix domain-containing protein [Eubacteriales bacterium]
MSVIHVGISPMLSFCHAHTHDCWEIVLNQQGEGHMQIGKYSYPYYPGTIICQPPNVHHEKFCNGFFRDIYIQMSRFALSDPSHTGKALVFQDDAERSFETLLLMANRIYHRNENNCQQVLQGLSETMEQLLISWYQHSPKNLQVEQLKNAIIDSFTNPEFPISDILSRGAYCSDHLRRLFRQETGFTPLEYLTELRINNAKMLMKESKNLRYTIADISMMSGFYDSGYFSRVFKKKTGITPTQYLNTINNG